LGLINRLQAVKTDDIKDGEVNWDKFEKFGEILSVITDCQRRGSVISAEPSSRIKKVIEELPVIDHEDVSHHRD
jgi:hypothetical protein